MGQASWGAGAGAGAPVLPHSCSPFVAAAKEPRASRPSSVAQPTSMSQNPLITSVLSSSQPMPPAPTASTLARATCSRAAWKAGGWAAGVRFGTRSININLYRIKDTL